MKTLTEIANYYGTDKGSSGHNYTQFYEQYFEVERNRFINLLEIGIDNGASLSMWEEYFPNARIDAFDIMDLKKFQKDRVNIHIGDQGNRNELNSIIKNINVTPNIIIDDGSHFADDQQISLGVLFDFLAPGGIYVIEDVFPLVLTSAVLLTSRRENISVPPNVSNKYYVGPGFSEKNFVPILLSSGIRSRSPKIDYSRGFPGVKGHKVSTLDILVNFCFNGIIDSPDMTDSEIKYLNKNIDFINIHQSSIHDLLICFIGKK